MKNKKRKRRSYTYEEGLTAKRSVKEKLRILNKKLLLLMVGIFVVLTVTYYILIAHCVIWASPVLYTLAAVLFLTFYFVNRGFTREVIPREALPEDWDEERKNAFIEDDTARKAFAKKLMVPLVPLLFLVGFDILYTVVFPLLKS